MSETKPDIKGKPEAGEEKPKLNLTFVFNDLTMRIQMKSTTAFKKAFDSAYERFKQSAKTVRFMFEGQRVRETDTPADYDMEDGDQIDVQVEQLGGGEIVF